MPCSLIYGTSVPPRLEGPTLGELRIRVEKMILDDDAINHNPYVRLSGGHAHVQPDHTHSRHGVSSPNRFVVPVDHCAVSPLFWGEVQPSATCQPATPQQTRGCATLVYPIKVKEERFAEYIHNMNQSPHHGLQLEVYVPSSYSGRSAVPIGKAIVNLQTLQSGKPLQGWFSVAHYPADASIEGGDAHHDHDENDDDDDDGDDRAPSFVVIGKVKLHFAVSFFPGARATRGAKTQRVGQHAMRQRRGAAVRGEESVATPGPSTTHNDYDAEIVVNESSDEDEEFIQPHRKRQEHQQQQQQQHRGRSSKSPLRTATMTATTATHPPTNNNNNLNDLAASTPPPAVADTTTSANAPTHMPVPAEALSAPTRDDLASIVDRGIHLRERMTAALEQRGTSSIHAAAHRRELGRIRAEASGLNSTPRSSILAQRTTAVNTDVRADDVEMDADDSFYTGERSEEEVAVMKEVRADQHRRKEEAKQQQRVSKRTAANARGNSPAVVLPRVKHRTHDGQPRIPPPTTTAAATPPAGATPLNTMDGRCVLVEMTFSDLSFSSTPMTNDLAELRLQVRLSADITTERPSSGPFSSFVHQLPLAQPSIRLAFPVRSFSEERSRLVIECLKIHSQVRHTQEGGMMMEKPLGATREVVAEELVGLCIVGLFAQSREVVLRDPLTGLNNVYAHLSIRTGAQNGSVRGDGDAPHGVSSPTTAGVRRGEVFGGNDATHAGRTTSAPPASSPAVHPSPNSNNTTNSNTAEVGALISREARRSTPTPEDTSAAAVVATPPPAAAAVSAEMLAAASTNAAGVAAGAGDAAAGAVDGISPTTTTTTKPSDVIQTHQLIQAGDTRGMPLSVCASPTLALSLNISSARLISTVRVERRHSGAMDLISHTCPVMDDEIGAPNSFFVVEEVLSGEDGCSVGAVPEWRVEEVLQGHYDRTNVVPHSNKPVFDYAAILRLPMESVLLRQGGGDDVAGTSSSFRAHHPRRAPLLRELQLTLWHHISEGDEAHIPSVAEADEVTMEHNFWSNAACMGICKIDLRPLKYLAQLDGYYRIYHDPSANGAAVADTGVTTIRGCAEMPQHNEDGEGADGMVVGYVHIRVGLARP